MIRGENVSPMADCGRFNGELGKYTRWSPSELSQVLAAV